MKKIQFAALVFCVLIWSGCIDAVEPTDQSGANDDAIARAFKTGASEVQVEGEGVVTRILSDDLDGSRHQRFIVRLPSEQTLLITHNIDLAPRVDGLSVGDNISFNGEYAWNAEGGVVHWTHHDPQKRHTPGWLKYNGRIYQ
jgi:hypothetical protein